MRFLTDVNASGVLARRLQDMGYEVVQVTDRDAGMPDDEILLWLLGRLSSQKQRNSAFVEPRARDNRPNSNPLPQVQAVNRFLGDNLDETAMAGAVDTGLYRNRAVG
jgi:hypothetical protein